MNIIKLCYGKLDAESFMKDKIVKLEKNSISPFVAQFCSSYESE